MEPLPQPVHFFTSATTHRSAYFLDESWIGTRDFKLAFETVMEAKKALAHPDQSGYHVRAAARTALGMATGGNMEYGFSDAFIHGETASLVHAISRDGEAPTSIGFYDERTNPKEMVVSPCGNCRDILCSRMSDQAIIANGNEDIIVAGRLKNYLFEDYANSSSDPATKIELSELEMLEHVSKNNIDVYLPENFSIDPYAVILSSRTNLWKGNLYTNAGYDAVTPGLNAVMNYQFSNPSEDLQKIVVVQNSISDAPPRTLYRDRQSLNELDESLRFTTGRDHPLPIVLITLDTESRKIVNKAYTNTDEWLPYAFTPGEFGMEDSVAAISRKHFSRIKKSS